MCSYTGGNKYFERYNSSKILYFSSENIDEMIKKFEDLYPKIKDIKDNKENEVLFNNNFSIEKFGENYLKLIEKLYEE